MGGYSGGAINAASHREMGPPLRVTCALLAAVLTLAVLGAALAAVALVHGNRDVVIVEAPDGGSWSVPTSFGVVEAERLKRTSAGAHASGHGGFPEGVDLLTATVTLRNRLSRAVPYSRGLLRLRRDATGTTTTAVDPRRSAVGLAAGATVHEEISFLVPAGAASFTLQFEDLERARTAAIALGPIAGVPEGEDR